jgi:hypothetical protein
MGSEVSVSGAPTEHGQKMSSDRLKRWRYAPNQQHVVAPPWLGSQTPHRSPLRFVGLAMCVLMTAPSERVFDVSRNNAESTSALIMTDFKLILWVRSGRSLNRSFFPKETKRTNSSLRTRERRYGNTRSKLDHLFFSSMQL